MKKVYILNKSFHDYSEAEKFGELTYITEGHLDKYNTNKMLRYLNEAFKDASPDDYILVTSLTIFCSLACSLFTARFKRLNILLYKDSSYVERRHTFEGVEEGV